MEYRALQASRCSRYASDLSSENKPVGMDVMALELMFLRVCVEVAQFRVEQ